MVAWQIAHIVMALVVWLTLLGLIVWGLRRAAEQQEQIEKLHDELKELHDSKDRQMADLMRALWDLARGGPGRWPEKAELPDEVRRR